MKLFQIALLLFNVIPVAKSADKPTPETFDVYWTKSRTESGKKDQDPKEKPKYERRSNFLLIDSVDEFKEIEFGATVKENQHPRIKKKALDSGDEVMFEALANDLTVQRNGMKAMTKEMIKQFNEDIQEKAEKDPMDDKLPLQLKIEGDFSVTFTGLKLKTLLNLLKMDFPDGVNGPDRIWAQLRFVNDVDKRTENIVKYIKEQMTHIEGTDGSPTQATPSGRPEPPPRKGGANRAPAGAHGEAKEEGFEKRNETM